MMATAGRRDEAIGRARDLVCQFPDDPWGRIFAGDVHRELGDSAGARRHFLDAQAMARDPSDRETAAERLQRMSEKPAAAEPRKIPQRRPAPGPTRLPGFEATPAIPTTAEDTPPAPGKKVGRNDPCPCGSGKKYKKCCLR